MSDPNAYEQTCFMVAAASDGTVQTINIGKSDDSVPIYYELETHELEFGNRAHLKKIADEIGVMAQFAADSSLEAATDINDYSPIPMSMGARVNIGQNINIEGHYMTFRWFGHSSTSTPVLEGLYLENVTDKGMTNS